MRILGSPKNGAMVNTKTRNKHFLNFGNCRLNAEMTILIIPDTLIFLIPNAQTLSRAVQKINGPLNVKYKPLVV
jgi:hypothetical protein